MKYYYAPGMYYPYYTVSEHVAVNADSDTDMGNMSPEEFHQYFPRAFEISKEQYSARTIDPLDGVRWAQLLRLQSKDSE